MRRGVLYSPYMPEEKLRADYAAVDRNYQRDLRVVGWRPKLLRAGVIAWAILDIALVGFFVVSIVVYVVSGSFQDVRDVATIARNVGVAHMVSLTRAAEPMLLGDARVLTRDQGSYDMYAVVENPNAEWYATFDYYFIAGSLTTTTTQASLMPSESRYVLGLKVAAATRPSGAELVVENVVWQRVDRHEVLDTEEFLSDHEGFTVLSSEYAPDVIFEKDTVGRSTFTIKNDTAYSYFTPTFAVLLKRGGVVVAVNQVTLSQFASGETREVIVHWFGDVPASGLVEILPQLNYFDRSVYMAPEGELGDDIRDRPVRR